MIERLRSSEFDAEKLFCKVYIRRVLFPECEQFVYEGVFQCSVGNRRRPFIDETCFQFSYNSVTIPLKDIHKSGSYVIFRQLQAYACLMIANFDIPASTLPRTRTDYPLQTNEKWEAN